MASDSPTDCKCRKLDDYVTPGEDNIWSLISISPDKSACRKLSPHLASILADYRQIGGKVSSGASFHYARNLARRTDGPAHCCRGGWMKPLPLCAALIFLLLLLASCTSRFSENDIVNTESAIRTDFEHRGFTVEQVTLIKESDRRLSGFVRFKKSAGLLRQVQLKNCIATADADSSKYIWECK